ncbi:hypothetical protein EHS25_005646 [Saitozyma podzolica]|uniref:Uncharacterized protein n=1 Tax=Saitozyma podzolica TaxID=1890683 RepID=A0A427XVV1_9TREE|nr:hypothetical protein EHS25_005646 [Saitozyma podzolica]
MVGVARAHPTVVRLVHALSRENPTATSEQLDVRVVDPQCAETIQEVGLPANNTLIHVRTAELANEDCILLDLSTTIEFSRTILGDHQLKVLVLYGSLKERQVNEDVCDPESGKVHQSSLPLAWKSFTPAGRLMPSSNRDRLVDVCEELVKTSSILYLHFDLLNDRFSEREERRIKGMLQTQAEGVQGGEDEDSGGEDVEVGGDSRGSSGDGGGKGGGEDGHRHMTTQERMAGNVTSRIECDCAWSREAKAAVRVGIPIP